MHSQIDIHNLNSQIDSCCFDITELTVGLTLVWNDSGSIMRQISGNGEPVIIARHLAETEQPGDVTSPVSRQEEFKRSSKKTSKHKRSSHVAAWRPQVSPYHVHCAEHVAVVVAGLQVLGDVGKRAQVLRVLGCTRDVTNLVLRNDVLHGEERQHSTH